MCQYASVCVCACVCATGSATQAGRIFYIRQRQAAAAAATATRGCQRKEKASSSSRSGQRGRAKGNSRRGRRKRREGERERGEGNRQQANAGSHCKFQLPLHVTFAYTLLLPACLHDFIPPLACLPVPPACLPCPLAPLPLPAFLPTGYAKQDALETRIKIWPWVELALLPLLPMSSCWASLSPAGYAQQRLSCCPVVLLCPVAHCNQLQ